MDGAYTPHEMAKQIAQRFAVPAAAPADAQHQPNGTTVGEIAEMDDGALVPVWTDGTPAAGTKLYAAPPQAPAEVDADVHELRKWLNEEPNRPLDRAALARVLAAHQPQPKGTEGPEVVPREWCNTLR